MQRRITAYQQLGVFHADAQKLAAEFLPHRAGELAADVVGVHIYYIVGNILQGQRLVGIVGVHIGKHLLHKIIAAGSTALLA